MRYVVAIAIMAVLIAGCGRQTSAPIAQQRLTLPRQAAASSSQGDHPPKYLRPRLQVPKSWHTTAADAPHTLAVVGGPGQCQVTVRGHWELDINSGSNPLMFAQSLLTPTGASRVLPSQHGTLSNPALFNFYQQLLSNWPGAWSSGPEFADPVTGRPIQTSYAVWRIGQDHAETSEETDYWLLVELQATTNFTHCVQGQSGKLTAAVQQALTTITWTDKP